MPRHGLLKKLTGSHAGHSHHHHEPREDEPEMVPMDVYNQLQKELQDLRAEHDDVVENLELARCSARHWEEQLSEEVSDVAMLKEALAESELRSSELTTRLEASSAELALRLEASSAEQRHEEQRSPLGARIRAAGSGSSRDTVEGSAGFADLSEADLSERDCAMAEGAGTSESSTSSAHHRTFEMRERDGASAERCTLREETAAGSGSPVMPALPFEPPARERAGTVGVLSGLQSGLCEAATAGSDSSPGRVHSSKSEVMELNSLVAELRAQLAEAAAEASPEDWATVQSHCSEPHAGEHSSPAAELLTRGRSLPGGLGRSESEAGEHDEKAAETATPRDRASSEGHSPLSAVKGFGFAVKGFLSKGTKAAIAGPSCGSQVPSSDSEVTTLNSLVAELRAELEEAAAGRVDTEAEVHRLQSDASEREGAIAELRSLASREEAEVLGRLRHLESETRERDDELLAAHSALGEELRQTLRERDAAEQAVDETAAAEAARWCADRSAGIKVAAELVAVQTECAALQEEVLDARAAAADSEVQTGASRAELSRASEAEQRAQCEIALLGQRAAKAEASASEDAAVAAAAFREETAGAESAVRALREELRAARGAAAARPDDEALCSAREEVVQLKEQLMGTEYALRVTSEAVAEKDDSARLVGRASGMSAESVATFSGSQGRWNLGASGSRGSSPRRGLDDEEDTNPFSQDQNPFSQDVCCPGDGGASEGGSEQPASQVHQANGKISPEGFGGAADDVAQLRAALVEEATKSAQFAAGAAAAADDAERLRATLWEESVKFKRLTEKVLQVEESRRRLLHGLAADADAEAEMRALAEVVGRATRAIAAVTREVPGTNGAPANK